MNKEISEGYSALQRMWTKEDVTFSIHKLIFKSMVYDAAFSGLEAVVLNKSEYEASERCVVRKARALLKTSGWGTKTEGERCKEFKQKGEVKR